jgi:hypothetical protein
MTSLRRSTFLRPALILGAAWLCSFWPAAVRADTPITSCGEITQSGNYILSTDLANSSTSVPCLAIHDVSNVQLNCQSHSVSSNNPDGAIELNNVSNFSISQCNLVQLSPTTSYAVALFIRNSHDGTLSYNSIQGARVNNGTPVDSSYNLQVSRNQFTLGYDQWYAHDNVIQNNIFNIPSINGPGSSDGVGSNWGARNQILNNTINGGWDSIPRLSPLGLDDGILLSNEDSDLIENNHISNTWDAGIETENVISSLTISGNDITNCMQVAIGGWYGNSWLGNHVLNNNADHVPSLFKFLFAGALQPYQTNVYFLNNDFEGNVLHTTSHLNWTSPFSDFNISAPLPSDTFVLGNNRLANNNFGTADLAPDFYPASMIVDGGGNICAPPSTTQGYPIVCNSAGPPPPLGTDFVTSVASWGTSRNNFDGWVGMEVQVGSSPLTVSYLGRLYLPDNKNYAHEIKFVLASTGQDVPGGAVLLIPSGTPNEFSYKALEPPVILAPHTLYYLVSSEQSLGDSWYDQDHTVLATTPDASILGPVSEAASTANAWNVAASAQHSHVPVDFRYQILLSTPNLSVNPTGLSFTASAGGSSAAPQFVTLSNAGAAASNWSVTLDPTALWLTVPTSSGSVTAHGGTQQVQINTAVGALAAGTYTGTLMFTDQSGTPLSVAVTLVVTVLSIPLAPPDLSSIDGKIVTLQDTLSLNYSGPVSGFNWEFDRLEGSSTGISGVSRSVAPSDAVVKIPSTSPRLRLAGLALIPGPYTLRVQVQNGVQSSAWATASITLVSADLAGARIWPNPFRASRGDRAIIFDQLPAGATVKIFTLSARHVITLQAPAGSATWSVTNDSGDKVASGIYLYLITDNQGNKTRGQLTVIR